jgi:hypothetical protein
MARRGFDTYMEYERGFHGWLVFFFITACIGALLRVYILFQVSRMLWLVASSGELGLISATVGEVLIAVILVLAMAFGLRLFANQDARTPRFWAGYFLAAIPLDIAVHALMAVQTTYYEPTSFGAAFLDALRTGGLRGAAISLAWALYWMRSKRVRLTYGTAGFERPTEIPVGIANEVS